MSSDPKGLGAKFDPHTDAEFNTRDIERPWRRRRM